MSPRTTEQNKAIRARTRQQIIEASFELFANAGYSKTSMAMVAEKARVSKGLIYHYFPGKQAILEAIVDGLSQLASEMLSFPEGTTPAGKLKYIIEQTFDFIEHRPALGKLMINLALQKDAFDAIRTKVDQINKEQIELLANVLEELGYKDPVLTAYELGAMFDGILLAYVATGDDYPLHQMKQKIISDYVPD